MKKLFVFLMVALLAIPLTTEAKPYKPFEVYSKFDLYAIVGTDLITQDWSLYPVNTVLENTTLDGITYHTGDNLVVGSPHGGGWLLGFTLDGAKYSSFNSHTISFIFDEPIDAFGIALSQGNQNGGVRREGYTVWSVSEDQEREFLVRVDCTVNDFSCESYLGITGLKKTTLIEVEVDYSDIGISWNIREISYHVRKSNNRGGNDK